MRYCYGTCQSVFDFGKRVRFVKDVRNTIAIRTDRETPAG